MKWRKLGNIYSADDHPIYSHAMFPEVECLDKENGRLRIYYTHRDINNYGFPTYLEGNIQNNKFTITYNHHEPIISRGNIGNFDDSGVNITSLINIDNKKIFYYYGWNLGITVPFRNSIGLAELSNQKKIFLQRKFEGPILDRTPHSPGLCATPCVIKIDNFYRMYFTQGKPWIMKDEKPSVSCNIAYADSVDGINWTRNNQVCVENQENDHVVTTPFVLFDNGVYKMWYSYRGEKYRIGYAESLDGINFKRKDDEVGITVSESGWDFEMICYPKVFEVFDNKYMIYCGNDFGRTGFGLAILEG